MARTKAVRWHALAVFDELKTRLLKSRSVLRSKGNANTKRASLGSRGDPKGAVSLN